MYLYFDEDFFNLFFYLVKRIIDEKLHFENEIDKNLSLCSVHHKQDLKQTPGDPKILSISMKL